MEEQKRPPKRKRDRKVLIVLSVLIAIGLIVLRLILHWPTESGFTISRETTYITGPLNPDGTINYVAALNEMMSKGVTGENNAAPLLITAYGPDVIDESIREKVLTMLGLAELPADGEYFQGFTAYVESGGIEVEVPRELPNDVCTAPWSAEKHPRVAAWLKANEKPLSLVAEASKRPRYYLPLVSESSNPRLVETVAQFPPYLTLVEALSARAMLRLDGGDVDGAAADLLALHRLARLLAQPPLLIDKLIALAVEERAAQGTVALANSGRLAADQARRMLLALDTLGPMPEIVDAIDHGERFFTLDCVMMVFAGGSLDGTDSGPLTSSKYYGRAIDWDRMLRNLNRWYDRIVAAAREPNARKRLKAANALKNDLERMKPEPLSSIIKLILGILGGRSSKAVVTDAVSNVLIAIMTPVFSGFSNSRYGDVVRYDLARIALALGALKAEKGEYPAKLASLVPAYMKEVPGDPFSDKPLIYKRDGKGYLLYSVGQNMTDDGGVEDEAADKDDIVVRVK